LKYYRETYPDLDIDHRNTHFATALHCAAMYGCIHGMKTLIELGADLRKVQSSRRLGNNILHFAHPAAVDWLFEHHKTVMLELVEQKDDLNRTPLEHSFWEDGKLPRLW
jgi:hypothetical protein